jgi:hypothetical protein
MQQVIGRYICVGCQKVSGVCEAQQNQHDVIISQEIEHICGEKAEFFPLYSVGLSNKAEYEVADTEFKVVS